MAQVSHPDVHDGGMGNGGNQLPGGRVKGIGTGPRVGKQKDARGREAGACDEEVRVGVSGEINAGHSFGLGDTQGRDISLQRASKQEGDSRVKPCDHVVVAIAVDVNDVVSHGECHGKGGRDGGDFPMGLVDGTSIDDVSAVDKVRDRVTVEIGGRDDVVDTHKGFGCRECRGTQGRPEGRGKEHQIWSRDLDHKIIQP